MQQTLESKYEIKEGLILDTDFFIRNYLYGLPLFDKSGFGDTFKMIEEKIRSAQQEFENWLSIKLFPRIIYESRDFVREEWLTWGFITSTYPITELFTLDGWINNVRQIQYPREWLSTQQTNSPATGLSRNVYIIGGTGTVAKRESVVFSGITPHLGFLGQRYIPNYWRLTYCSGFDPVPADLRDVVGKYAAMQVLSLLGDITFGAGIASLSLSFDGFSQSLGTTQSAENSLYSARLRQYEREFKDQLKRIYYAYKGMTFNVC